MADANDLALGHLDRLKHELKQEVDSLKSMIVTWLLVLGLAIVGAVHVTSAAALALADGTGWQLWLCYGLVASVVLLLAGIVVISRQAAKEEL